MLLSEQCATKNSKSGVVSIDMGILLKKGNIQDDLLVHVDALYNLGRSPDIQVETLSCNKVPVIMLLTIHQSNSHKSVKYKADNYTNLLIAFVSITRQKCHHDAVLVQ